MMDMVTSHRYAKDSRMDWVSMACIATWSCASYLICGFYNNYIYSYNFFLFKNTRPR